MTFDQIHAELLEANRRDELPVNLLAHFFFNVERLTVAQEIIAGIRSRPLTPTKHGLNGTANADAHE